MIITLMKKVDADVSKNFKIYMSRINTFFSLWYLQKKKKKKKKEKQKGRKLRI